MKSEEKFEILKIVIDKLLIGAIIALIGIFGNTWIEHYKDDLTRKRTFYEKKYDMLDKLQAAYKDVTIEVFSCINDTTGHCFEDEMRNKKIFNKLIVFDNKVEKITPYVSKEYAKVLESYVWIYGARFNTLNNVVEYANFLNELEDSFDEYTRCELDNSFHRDK